MDWYYEKSGRRKGPVEWEALVRLAQEGGLQPSDLVWSEDIGRDWVEAGTLTSLFASPPGSPSRAAAEAVPPPLKQRFSTCLAVKR